jgi:two-component system response regulator AtoC
LHSGGPVTAADFEEIGAVFPRQSLPQPTEKISVASYHEERQEFERTYLGRLMRASGGNVTEAAQLSGIPRQSIYVRMKRWGFIMES